ncbi:TPA: biotin/lipoyl-binding protein, partial [Yersinia enterocolitica]|nr:biotin/lipoyl-binding protein [Yersinia enterocolitica]
MIFRQDAIDNKRNYWSGRSLLISGIPVWIIVTFTLLFFTLLMVIIIFGSYHRRVQISGELISVPRAVTVFSSQQGYVVSQFVNVGDKVKKGQPLYQIDISRTTTSGIVSQNQKASIEKQIGAIENIILRIKENKKVTVSNLNEQKLSYETALQHSAEILKKSQVGLSIM